VKPDPKKWHFLPAYSAGNESCCLLLSHDLPAGINRALRQTLGILSYHFDDEVPCWYFDNGYYAISILEDRYEVNACERCAVGTPCEAWDVERLREEGYEPRAGRSKDPLPVWPSHARTYAERLLEVCPGASLEEIQQAFRKKALTTHPDQGGSNEAMQELLKARDVLISKTID
jgi:hypothetical protein